VVEYNTNVELLDYCVMSLFIGLLESITIKGTRATRKTAGKNYDNEVE